MTLSNYLIAHELGVILPDCTFEQYRQWKHSFASEDRQELVKLGGLIYDSLGEVGKDLTKTGSMQNDYSSLKDLLYSKITKKVGTPGRRNGPILSEIKRLFDNWEENYDLVMHAILEYNLESIKDKHPQIKTDIMDITAAAYGRLVHAFEPDNHGLIQRLTEYVGYLRENTSFERVEEYCFISDMAKTVELTFNLLGLHNQSEPYELKTQEFMLAYVTANAIQHHI